jgi:hypothetical protein
MRQIALQAFVGLPYAARDLDEDAAAGLGQAMQKAQRELQLAEFPPDDMESWFVALRQVIEQSSSTPGVAGLAARCCTRVRPAPRLRMDCLLLQAACPQA